MSTDRTVGDTFYMFFTTRAFATGIPTVLAGTPVVSAYEDDSITQITAGITLGVSHDSVVGLNLLTLVATGGNGYETGKDYSMVITTGTVGGVSVVGEVVGQFSLSLSAAAKDLANGTDGLGALKSDTAAILVDTAAMQPLVAKIPLSDGTITWNSTALASINAECDTAIGDAALATAANLATVDTNVDSILVDTSAMQPLVAKIPLSDGVITWNSTALASINAECDTALTDYDGPTNAEMDARTLLAAQYFNAVTDPVANVTLVTTTTTNTDMRGTDSAATATNLATVDSNVDAILVDTGTTLPAQITALNDVSVSDILTTQMTQSYAADGTAPTMAQALFLIMQTIGDFSIAGTTITVKQLDGSTTAATYTLDDATNPTSRTRAT